MGIGGAFVWTVDKTKIGFQTAFSIQGVHDILLTEHAALLPLKVNTNGKRDFDMSPF